MISAINYLLRETRTRALTLLLITGLVIGFVPLAATHAAAVQVTTSAYTDGANGQQGIDIYSTGGANKPGIIFVHGGGWRAGDKSQYAGLGNDAANRGYVAASINYRLGSGGIYYQYEDVMRAVQHIRANAAQYGMNPNKIAIWGDSAGGSLAMRVAASGQSGLAGAVGWSAPVNAYTAIFNSLESFAIGADHSTCIPTDPSSISTFLQKLPRSAGGTGPDTTGTPITTSDAMNLLGRGPATPTYTATPSTSSSQVNQTLTQFLAAAQQGVATSGDPHVRNASQAAQFLTQSAQNNGNTLSAYDSQSATNASPAPNAATATHTAISQIPAEGQRAILAVTDMLGCQDNFRALSPALNFAPNTPPTFLANAQSEYLVHPGQAIEYSDNLRAKGIDSSYLILPGSTHMGYDARAVNPSFAFLDRHLK